VVSVGTVSFCDWVSILVVAHYANAVCHLSRTRIIITAATMAQNAAAETDGDGGVNETKDDVEYEDANNHDEKKTSLKTSLLTKLDQTRNFFWDPSTKQVLGRTWISWGTFCPIELIYLITAVINELVLPSDNGYISVATHSGPPAIVIVYRLDLECLERSY